MQECEQVIALRKELHAIWDTRTPTLPSFTAEKVEADLTNIRVHEWCVRFAPMYLRTTYDMEECVGNKEMREYVAKAMARHFETLCGEKLLTGPRHY